MAAEVLRPTAVTLNGWTGVLGNVTPPIGAPNPANYIVSEAFVQSTYNYRSPVQFSFSNPTTPIPDTIRVRSVVQRTGTTGYLTYQVRLTINYYPFGSSNPYPRVLTSTHTLGPTDTAYHEVIDVFSVNTTDISHIDTLTLEYSLSPSGTNNSVTGAYDLQQMSADGSTLRLLSVAVEFDNVLSGSVNFSPPTMSFYLPWDTCPAFCVSADQQREAIAPRGILGETKGFSGNLQQLQDPFETADTITMAGSGVTATYSTENPVLALRLPAPQTVYDSAGFLNLRWKAHTLTGADVLSTRNYAITVYYTDDFGEQVWLGTFLEKLSASRDTSALNPKPGWTSTSIAVPLPSGVDVFNLQVFIRVLEDVTLTQLSVTSLTYSLRGVRPYAVYGPPGPPLPPSTLIVSPPVFNPTLINQPGSPPIPGPPTDFHPQLGVRNTCVAPPPPPLPIGSEVLRPNRDIQSLLVNPKPIWMQLNDPVNAPCGSFVAAPAEMDVYDEITGDKIQTYIARFEVGFTQPQTSGPWQALQVRFMAARSRPPVNEAFDRLSTSCPDVVTGTFPGTEVLAPTSSTLGQSWAPAPAWWVLNEPIYQPEGCFVSQSILEPTPLVLSFAEPSAANLQKIDGWASITTLVRARLRAVQYQYNQNQLSGIDANYLTYSGLVGYQVRFEPKNPLGEVTAVAVSPTRIEGTAIIRSNISTWLELQFASPHHTVLPTLSSDGVVYQDRIRIFVQPLLQKLIYFALDISQNGDTPVGQYHVGLIAALDGESYITPDTLQTNALTFNVQNNALESIDPTSLVRIKTTLLGESFLGVLPQRTSLLTTKWTTYEITWSDQVFPIRAVHDLRVQIETESLYGGDEMAVVDLDVVSLLATPYIEGVSEIPTPSTSTCQLELVPVQDLDVTGWTEPCSAKLRTPPASAERLVSIEVNTLVQNNLLMAMDFETPPGTDYQNKTFGEVIVQIAARVLTSYPDINTELDVSTNLTGHKTVQLTSTWQVYEVVWLLDPAQPLSVFQNRKTKVQISGSSTGSSSTGAVIQIAAVRAVLSCSDVPLSLPPTIYGLPLAPRTYTNPVSPPVSVGACTISSLPTTVEVFSVGSLQSGAGRPSAPVFSFSVSNRTASTAVLKIDIVGAVEYWTTPSSLQTILSGSVMEFSVYLAVGSSSNPYPDETENGLVRITLSVPSQSDKVSVIRWFYGGMD